MKLSVKAMAAAGGLLWGGGMLAVAMGNLISSSYGTAFLEVMSSVYNGYHASGTFGDALVGGAYGLVDGALGGAVLAWLYNIFAVRLQKTT